MEPLRLAKCSTWSRRSCKSPWQWILCLSHLQAWMLHNQMWPKIRKQTSRWPLLTQRNSIRMWKSLQMRQTIVRGSERPYKTKYTGRLSCIKPESFLLSKPSRCNSEPFRSQTGSIHFTTASRWSQRGKSVRSATRSWPFAISRSRSKGRRVMLTVKRSRSWRSKYQRLIELSK